MDKRPFTPQQWIVPKQLRNKSVISRVSREIFFIDCLNDLRNCAIYGSSYNLIRASVLLRMLLLDRGISTIAKNYEFKLKLLANAHDMGGTNLTSKQIGDVWNVLKPLQNRAPSLSHLTLIYEPLKEHTLDQFLARTCISFGDKEFNFSVANVIKLLANNHGAAHLESSFDSSQLDSFHLDDFNPFSINNGNKFLLKIKEIIMIVLEALKPLANDVLIHLYQYDKSEIQHSTTHEARLISKEEAERLYGKKLS